MSNIYNPIQEAITDSSDSQRQICIKAGINQSQLSRFMSGERGLSIEAIEKLAECLDLEIIVRPRSNKKKVK